MRVVAAGRVVECDLQTALTVVHDGNRVGVAGTDDYERAVVKVDRARVAPRIEYFQRWPSGGRGHPVGTMWHFIEVIPPEDRRARTRKGQQRRLTNPLDGANGIAGTRLLMDVAADFLPGMALQTKPATGRQTWRFVRMTCQPGHRQRTETQSESI